MGALYTVKGVHGVDKKNVTNLNLRGPGVDHIEDTSARARTCIKIDVLPAMAAPRGQSTAHRQAKSTAEKRVGRDQRAAPNSRVDPSRDPRAVVPRARPARVRAAVYSPSLSNGPVLPRAVLLSAVSIRPELAAASSSHDALPAEPSTPHAPSTA